MKKSRNKGIKKHIQRHFLSIVLILIAALLTASFFYWYLPAAEAKIVTDQNNTALKSSQLDEQIAQIKAKKAAELKAKQEAAAKIAADQARDADGSTASSINSADCNTSITHNNPALIDVLVNKKHCMQPVSYVPSDLVAIGSGFVLSAKAAPSFNALMSAASAQGIPLTITSSYRSYENQVSTYAYWVGVSGKAGADTYSARPGYSEHQTGFVIDVASNGCALDCFGSTSAYAWMQAHAADYGFIQRYYAGYDPITGYKAEEWHYRYVGTAIAKDMRTKAIMTLEEYWGLSGGDYY